MGFFPKVMRAAAGPHDLGPGQNRNGAFPELTAQPGLSPDDDDEYNPPSGREVQDSDSGDDSDPNIVVHNTSDVRRPP